MAGTAVGGETLEIDQDLEAVLRDPLGGLAIGVKAEVDHVVERRDDVLTEVRSVAAPDVVAEKLEPVAVLEAEQL